MPALLTLFQGATQTVSMAGMLYTAAVTAAALASFTLRTPQRRREARETLKILLGRHGR